MAIRRRSVGIIVALGFCVVVQIATSTPALAQGIVWGTVVNGMNIPIPGLTVSLVHPTVGRSYPSFTDPFGRFVFYNVPAVPGPYYLEIYWGQQLLYRSTLFMNAPRVQVPPIVLR